MSYNVSFLTLYPEAFPGYLGFGVANRALLKNIWNFKVYNIRDFATDKHKRVDDKVFGGGDGLLLKPDVLGKCIDYALSCGASTNLYYPSAGGKQLNSTYAEQLSMLDGITFVCGHFEGIDHRIIEKYNIKELSIGDYILSGGELSSMVILDSVLRFLPNVLNSKECIKEESFSDNLLEYPQYTKPYDYCNMKVPEVLLSGNHSKIKEWRLEESKLKTKKIRPDLWEKYKNNNTH